MILILIVLSVLIDYFNIDSLLCSSIREFVVNVVACVCVCVCVTDNTFDVDVMFFVEETMINRFFINPNPNKKA